MYIIIIIIIIAPPTAQGHLRALTKWGQAQTSLRKELTQRDRLKQLFLTLPLQGIQTRRLRSLSSPPGQFMSMSSTLCLRFFSFSFFLFHRVGPGGGDCVSGCMMKGFTVFSGICTKTNPLLCVRFPD